MDQKPGMFRDWLSAILYIGSMASMIGAAICAICDLWIPACVLAIFGLFFISIWWGDRV